MMRNFSTDALAALNPAAYPARVSTIPSLSAPGVSDAIAADIGCILHACNEAYRHIRAESGDRRSLDGFKSMLRDLIALCNEEVNHD